MLKYIFHASSSCYRCLFKDNTHITGWWLLGFHYPITTQEAIQLLDDFFNANPLLQISNFVICL